MNMWMLWFIFVFLPNFNGFLTLVLFFTPFLTVCLYYFIYHEAKDWKVYKTYLAILLTTVILFISIPNEKSIYLLTGSYFVTNIEGIENLPPNLVNSVNTFLENYQSSNIP